MTSSCRVGASGYTIRQFARWLVVSPSPEGDGGEGGGDVGSTPHSRYPTTARSHPLCSLLRFKVQPAQLEVTLRDTLGKLRSCFCLLEPSESVGIE
ncbi:hypothetical protein KQX54_020916 [Cotesia glomerata]|uniref:Uncharacterized protein n=1 Tax=Cotesia glomerata TaxID=32391 RepID=A0AAV7IIA7_COTGL|nr:hypothetical protein KQX54_020916 [Cotesia glomerata]